MELSGQELLVLKNPFSIAGYGGGSNHDNDRNICDTTSIESAGVTKDVGIRGAWYSCTSSKQCKKGLICRYGGNAGLNAELVDV